MDLPSVVGISLSLDALSPGAKTLVGSLICALDGHTARKDDLLRQLFTFFEFDPSEWRRERDPAKDHGPTLRKTQKALSSAILDRRCRQGVPSVGSNDNAVAELQYFIRHVVVHRTSATEDLLTYECDAGTTFKPAPPTEQHSDLGTEEGAVWELDLHAPRQLSIFGINVEACIFATEHWAHALVIAEKLNGHTLDVIPTG